MARGFFYYVVGANLDAGDRQSLEAILAAGSELAALTGHVR
ncbi:hypothetical protein [Nocardia vaccinii]|nr:hypothetical protein [Nocardia vaccinii]